MFSRHVSTSLGIRIKFPKFQNFPLPNNTTSSRLLTLSSFNFQNASSNNSQKSSSLPGLFFDIDGVLTRGGATIPAAIKAFNKIYDPKIKKFKVPVVFVTNAGNTLNSLKAKDLTRILGCQIEQSQVIMSHTPLMHKSLSSNHGKFSLISGQGPIVEIANQLGFKNHITVAELKELFPYLAMVNQQTRPTNPTIHSSSDPPKIPKIEQVVMFGEPQSWDTDLQLILDCLLTDGDFWQERSQQDYENFGVLNPANDVKTARQIPVIAANMDLQWQAEAPGPRFGHGMFLNILESSFRKLTGGRELEYTALAGKPATLTYEFAEDLLQNMTAREYDCELSNVYCIGDNLMSDIYGANMYTSPFRKFKSMLVCTGVYHPESRENFKELKKNIKSININHAPRDYQEYILKERGLLRPDYLFEDVHECVEFVFEKEKIGVEGVT